MASTFTAAPAAATAPAKGHGFSGNVKVAHGSYAITAALVVSDVIQMVKVPKGATIIDVMLSAPDLDTNASPTIVLDVGDGSDTDRFIDGSTVGQAGGVGRLNATAGIGHEYTVEDTVDVIVQVAPATGATSGTITLSVFYTLD